MHHVVSQMAGDNGIGRIDIVESRFVGMKSRGVYETPGGTVLMAAHRAMESICLDRGEMHLKDELMPRSVPLSSHFAHEHHCRYPNVMPIVAEIASPIG